ncbi:MAG: V-type ATP synthase subunit D [Acidimicrobiia bacterium]|nr:V-type ATP synthase subunit D [Acidimicrobiia bacterium]
MTSATTANRAARLHLQGRLDLATHASELLHSKEEALQREHNRLRGHADRTQADWHERLHQAAIWLLRARALGAGSELTTGSQPPERATVDINWRTSMGVTYPGTVRTTAGSTPAFTSTAALTPTRDAYAAALDAATEHAAARAALQRVEAELADTRRRRRALEQHLVPRLQSELHRLDLTLDERDRDAALRTQLAIRRRGAASAREPTP